MLSTRILVAIVVVLVLSVCLVGRYYFLQIEQFERYATISEENRVHVRPVKPTRGLIYDRNGVVVAENLPSYTLSIVRERTENIEQLLAELMLLLNLSDAELSEFRDQWPKYRRPYEGLPLRFQLTEDEVAKLAVNQFRLLGIEVEAELIRHYPQGELFAHTLGYVGRINDADQRRLDPLLYEGTYITGKIGIEKQYEDRLLGTVGSEYVETNARGRVLRVLDREDAIAGEDLWLHMDSRIQATLHELLEGRRAAVVAIEVETGGVLAMVSVPSFDPNLFVTGISGRAYSALLTDHDKPLYDRSLYGQYPPGSTVKPLYGLAGLAEGAITTDHTISDYGYFQLPEREYRYRDWKREGHGRVDLRIAIEQSCDVFFYELGNIAGIDVLSEYGDLFGLGRATNIDLPSERIGVMPSREWKSANRGSSWYPGDTINASIGQGFTLTTPLQLATMTAMLARRGKSIAPSVVRSVGGRENTLDVVVEDALEVPSEYWDAVYQGMEDVIHSPKGTAFKVGDGLAYRMAGKTGTAQVVSIDQDAEYDSEQLKERQRDHALFVGFAPLEDPKIAVSVILENGEASSAAAEIARVVMDEWYKFSLEDAANEDLVDEAGKAESVAGEIINEDVAALENDD